MPGYFHPVAFCCVTAPAASLESLSMGALAICGPGCILHGSRPRPLSGPPEPYGGKGKKKERKKKKFPIALEKEEINLCRYVHTEPYISWAPGDLVRLIKLQIGRKNEFLPEPLPKVEET